MPRGSRAGSAVPSADFDSLKRQRIIFTSLNLFLLLVLLALHASFASFWGRPSWTLTALLGVCAAIRVGELLALRGGRLNERTSAILTICSMALNLALALVLASVIDREDSQYSALLVVPILEAAFRFGPLAAIAAAVTSDLITFYWVWRYAVLHPPFHIGEYFEAGTQSIIFLIVAVLVSLLARQLYRSRDQLALNVRELEAARKRLLQEETLAAVGRLSSAVAHEIRNPVAMISSSLATAKMLSGIERDGMFEIAGQEASRLVTLTNDLLAYARPRRPSPTAGPVADTVAYVADVCRARAAQKSVSLRVDSPDRVFADYDRGLAEQALMNLVMNAVDASPSGGEVVLAVAPDGPDQVRIDVENEGGPIPSDIASRLFEPFFTTKRSGTGLGLAMAQNAARVQGGDVVLSRNSNAVCFSLILPRSVPCPES